jgi:hypothetical protein
MQNGNNKDNNGHTPLDSVVHVYKHYSVNKRLSELEIFRYLTEAGATLKGTYHDIGKKISTWETIEQTPDLLRIVEEINDKRADAVLHAIPVEPELSILICEMADSSPSASWINKHSAST